MFCGEPATIHLTQIVNNHTQKMDVCEACAKTKGVMESEAFSMANMFAKALGASLEANPSAPMPIPKIVKSQIKELTCPACGFKLSDLKVKGQLGCSECYTSFQKELAPIMENMHNKTTHVGKKSHTALTRAEDKSQLDTLQASLTTAIKKEHFEEAARIRDEIKKLKEQPDTSAKK